MQAGADPGARRPPGRSAFAYVGRMYVIGRGIEFATAREVALKLTETCRVAAEPLTSTDLSHGPIAALDPLFPVWTIASRDESLPAVIEAAERVADGCEHRRERKRCRPRSRAPPFGSRCRSPRCRSSRRCSLSCRASCSRPRSRWQAAGLRPPRRPHEGHTWPSSARSAHLRHRVPGTAGDARREARILEALAAAGSAGHSSCRAAGRERARR